MTQLITNPAIHVMFGGVSYDIDFEETEIQPSATDSQVREAVATWLNQPVSKLTNFTISRNVQTGDITLRPSAIFGRSHD